MEEYKGDNFDDDQNTDINKTENTGEISGFDEVTPLGYTDGYTVTPEGGYYNHTKNDIIQDDTPQDSPESESTKTPTGEEYSYTPDGVLGDIPNQNENAYKVPYIKGKRRYSAGVVIIASILAAVIGALSGVAVLTGRDGKINTTTLPSILEDEKKNDTKASNKSSNPNDVNISVPSDGANVSSIAQNVAAKASGSVIGIRTTTSVTSFFGGDSESTGEGSGVVYTADGYIITNYHVISGALTSGNRSKIEVFFNNCNTDPYEAQVVGYNISTDLAVLKINAKNITPATLGNSKNLAIGQYVITIGAPGGLEFMGSVTYGIISGLDRVVSSDSGIGLIQTDAAINPGNSGGALLDSNGKVIGINSSKIVSEEFEGMGFAIPINKVVEVCNNIISNKDNNDPYTGITISEKYTAEVLDYYGYPSGAVVSSVAQGSPAEETGITRGDIITEFNGVKITDYTVYYDTLAKCKSGDTVSVKIYRNGRNYKAKIKIMSNTVS